MVPNTGQGSQNRESSFSVVMVLSSLPVDRVSYLETERTDEDPRPYIGSVEVIPSFQGHAGGNGVSSFAGISMYQ